MNYIRIYNELIKKVQNEKRGKKEGYEKHHIIPKSIFNDIKVINTLNTFNVKVIEGDENLVYLTYKEHFIAHLLLYKMTISKNQKIKMLYAFNFINSRGFCRVYATHKAKYSEMMSNNMKGKPSRQKGNKWTEEQKQRARDSSKLRGKTYEEVYGPEEDIRQKEVRRQKQLGQKRPKDVCEKISKRAKERGPEWGQKISKAKKGVPMAEETKLKLKKIFSDSDRNPNIDRTEFILYHDDGRVVRATKHTMKKKYNVTNILKLVRGICKKSKGWTYKGEFYKKE